jgi:peptidoglycan/LPS O-acetylase OafA/YrhL
MTAWPLVQGVSFFFVLSGFILTYVYPSLDAPGAVRRFLVARVARIWPAHLATLLLAVWLMRSHSPPLPAIANVTMLHGWIRSRNIFSATTR